MSRTEAHVGVFLLDGFQELEFWYPVFRCREEGIRVTIIGRGENTTFSRLGYPVVAEASFTAVPNDCTVLLVPGGQISADASALEQMSGALQGAYQRGASIAATGNAVSVLGSAGLLKGIRVAAPARIKDRLDGYGASVTELAVCSDRRVLTARGANDLPQFFQAMFSSMQ